MCSRLMLLLTAVYSTLSQESILGSTPVTQYTYLPVLSGKTSLYLMTLVFGAAPPEGEVYIYALMLLM